MRTLIIIAAGFLCWAVLLAISRLLKGAGSPTTVATFAFVALWFVAAAFNMWFGVARAGYSFREELPIFLLIFLVPAAIAVWVWAKWSV